MKNVWNIFKQDVSNIKRVPLVGILLLGLAILPSLYAWINLSASWDPYANTEEVKVAIVNEDEGTTIQDDKINVGEELVDNLKDNNSLGWVFTDREDAEEGVRKGDYYAGIYIDADFSEELAKVIDGEPVQTTVTYQVNEKKNAIAPKMTSAGASTIVNTINEQFVDTAASTLFEEFNELGIRLEEDLPTIRKIKSALYELDENMPEIVRVGDFIQKIDDDWDDIDEQIDHFMDIQDYLPEIHKGTDQILELQKQFPKIYEITDHITEVEDALPDVKNAVDRFNDVGPMFDDVANFLTDAQERLADTKEQIHATQEKLANIDEHAETIEQYAEDIQSFLSEADIDAEPFVRASQTQLVKMDQTLTELSAYIQPAEGSEVDPDLSVIKQEIVGHIAYLESNIQVYDNLASVSDDGSMTGFIDEMEQTKASFNQLNQDVDALISGSDSTEIANHIETTQQHTDSLSTWLENNGESSLNNSFDQMQSTISESNMNMDELHDIKDSLQSLLSNADEVMDNIEQDMETIQADLPEWKEKWEEVNGKMQGAFPLVENAIHDFSGFVEHDLPNVEEKVNTLAGFIEDDFPRIEETYLNVVDEIKKNKSTVESAIHQLASFSQDKLPELQKGVKEAADKVHDAETQDQLNQLISILRNDLADESDFFASPVHLEEEDLFPVPNYGSANAPFYTTLCLWVGALLLSNLVSTNLHKLDRREDYTLRQIYFGRMILFVIVGILQAIIASIGDLTILGVYAHNPVQFVLYSIFISIVFMTIVYTFASILGNIGKALMIILLVLQLSSSGGTFPVEVAPPFFQHVHPFIPFTYGIDLLREAVGGVVPEVVRYNMIMLAIFWGVAIIIGVILKPLLAKRIDHTARKSKDSRLVE
ncbi:YhgE/Pip domain-containing protein [Gracilibacillus sp. S3-1-1]|uniref:YhgE/Pip domain-containing protein n=1 Tax=Gracilibacillus pellucidus TaxID=3095368 RepID=A0ACC6M760_9BACI|nr:YhgE/Pip domain-containing protein [Gracilibacillus sp. S3-1-1]MDX8046809.1 YhgE/Pip domain-containing protein [Gracilibacillus sp. S3-1-1]